MMEKRFNSRIVHKHAVEADWVKATNFIPLQGEIIVYDVDETHDYERIKVGDGITLINELEFMNDFLVADEINAICENEDYIPIISGSITADEINEICGAVINLT